MIFFFASPSGMRCLPPRGATWLKSSRIPLQMVFGEHPKALLSVLIELPLEPATLHAIKSLLSRSLSVPRYSFSAWPISTGGFFFISVTCWKPVTKIRKSLQLFYVIMLIINEIYHFFLKSSRYYNNIVTPCYLGVTIHEFKEIVFY